MNKFIHSRGMESLIVALTVDVKVCISNYIPLLYVVEITYPYLRADAGLIK